MHRALADSLAALSKESLIKIILALYDALFKALKKRVQSVNRGTRFVPYGESFALSQTLSTIVNDIKTFLLPISAKQTVELLELFLASVKNVFQRVDDSGGYVGECYRDAVVVWLAAANAWRRSDEVCNIHWQEEVYRLFQDNEYSIYDELIAGSAELLGETALRQLAWRFENEARQALNAAEDKNQKYNPAASHACIGLQSVGEALKDIA